MKKIYAALLAVVLFNETSQAQGFINLNFENATIVPDTASPFYPNAVYASDAIPGWTVTGVTFLPTNEILYDSLTTGSSAVSLMDTNTPYGTYYVLDGKYSIVLYNGVSISQTGLVPAGTDSILFEAQGDGSLDGPLLLSLGGESLSFVALSTGSNYTLYGGNIPSNFDGESEQLMFSVPTGQNNFWTIDDIQFSPTLVPEPSVLDLFALGGLFLVWRYRQKFSKTKA